MAFIFLVRLAAALITLAVTWRVSMSVEPFQFFSRLRAERTLLMEGLRFTVLEFLITLSTRIDLVMLSPLTSPVVLGVYAFAQSLADQGLLVRVAVSQSLFPASTKALVANRISARTIISHTALCGGLMLLPALLTPLVSSHLVAFIIGPNYANSVPIIDVLVFYLVFSYALLPAGVFLQAAGHESLIIGVGAVCAILNIGGNLWLFHLVGPIGIAYSTLIVFGASAVSQIGMALPYCLAERTPLPSPDGRAGRYSWTAQHSQQRPRSSWSVQAGAAPVWWPAFSSIPASIWARI